jgi:hypothetical protein
MWIQSDETKHSTNNVVLADRFLNWRLLSSDMWPRVGGYLPTIRRNQLPPFPGQKSSRLHDVTSQKTIGLTFVVTAMLNLKSHMVFELLVMQVFSFPADQMWRQIQRDNTGRNATSELHHIAYGTNADNVTLREQSGSAEQSPLPHKLAFRTSFLKWLIIF